MSPVSLVAIYFVLWWVAFMLTLPFGVKGADERVGPEAERTLGTDPGAPPVHHLRAKVVIASLLALAMLGVVYLVYGVWGMRLEDFIV